MESIKLGKKVNSVTDIIRKNKLVVSGMGLIALSEIKDIISHTNFNFSFKSITGIEMFDAVSFAGIPVGHIVGNFFAIFTVGTIAVSITRALMEIRKHPENTLQIIINEVVYTIIFIAGLGFLISFGGAMLKDTFSIHVNL